MQGYILRTSGKHGLRPELGSSAVFTEFGLGQARAQQRQIVGNSGAEAQAANAMVRAEDASAAEWRSSAAVAYACACAITAEFAGAKGQYLVAMVVDAARRFQAQLRAHRAQAITRHAHKLSLDAQRAQIIAESIGADADTFAKSRAKVSHAHMHALGDLSHS